MQASKAYDQGQAGMSEVQMQVTVGAMGYYWDIPSPLNTYTLRLFTHSSINVTYCILRSAYPQHVAQKFG